MKIFAKRNQTKVPVEVNYKGGLPYYYAEAFFRVEDDAGNMYSKKNRINFILRQLKNDDNYVSEVPEFVRSRSDVNKKVIQACMGYLVRQFAEYIDTDFEVAGLEIIEERTMRSTPTEYMFPKKD